MNNKFILNKYIPSELIDAVSEKSILATKDVFKTHLDNMKGIRKFSFKINLLFIEQSLSFLFLLIQR